MGYGVKIEGNKITCIMCDKVISENGSYREHFCSECGNPLSLTGLEIQENMLKEQRETVYNLFKELVDRGYSAELALKLIKREIDKA